MLPVIGRRPNAVSTASRDAQPEFPNVSSTAMIQSAVQPLRLSRGGPDSSKSTGFGVAQRAQSRTVAPMDPCSHGTSRADGQ